MQVYLDNAATTAPFPEVVEAMIPYLGNTYGNPSSTHAVGRESRTAIEMSRKNIAKIWGVTAKEIIFTSGGTEAINIFLQGIAHRYSHIISSKLEHPAVYKTLKFLENKKLATVTWLDVEKDGSISMKALENALDSNSNSLVALMHGNNEIGNILPLEEASALCNHYNSSLFVDAVQTAGHYPLNLKKLAITGLSGSAHKFNGPKGIGFLYLKDGIRLNSIYQGGEQERKLRAGTENVAAIVGMNKALELCHSRMHEDRKHIESLKKLLIKELKEKINGIQFNGTSDSFDKSIYTILSASFPPHPNNDMLLFNLDLAGINVSAGSACASGAIAESQVMKAIGHDPARATIRFSFSRNNTIEEIEYVIKSIIEVYHNI
ncbi:MAG: cysteine desulfurase family protein [Bacteroidota bacterium]